MIMLTAKTDVNKLTTDELRHYMKAVRSCKCILVCKVLNAVLCGVGEARCYDKFKGAVYAAVSHD